MFQRRQAEGFHGLAEAAQGRGGPRGDFVQAHFQVDLGESRAERFQHAGQDGAATCAADAAAGLVGSPILGGVAQSPFGFVVRPGHTGDFDEREEFVRTHQTHDLAGQIDRVSFHRVCGHRVIGRCVIGRSAIKRAVIPTEATQRRFQLLKQHSEGKSLAMQRRRCGWNFDTLLNVLDAQRT